jgi:hypothetical protein
MRLAVLLVALFAFPALAAEPVPLSENSMFEWSGNDGELQVFTSGDLTLTLTVTGDPSERLATLKVEKGSETAEVSGLGSGGGFGVLGVFPFDENGMRTVIFATYAGGAHCCMQTEQVTETPNGFVTGHVITVDGDIIAPEDLDGDGVYELPTWDDRFGYAFDAYAYSFMPPRIMKSKDGVAYDASADPRYRSLFEESMERARENCSGDIWDLGSCAGLLGVAARLGTYEEELGPILAAIDAGRKTSGWDDFSFCIDETCDQRKTVTGFAEALDYALRQWGYLPPR